MNPETLLARLGPLRMSFFPVRLRIQTFIAASSALDGGIVFADPEFDSSIRPLVENYCLACHGGRK